MRALILAAGRGNRLRPYTDTIPKPLLPVGDALLCEWQFAALKKAGIHEVVMNTAHLADAFESIPRYFAKKGFDVKISREGCVAEDALESLGGIAKALSLLVDETDPEAPFLVLAGDVVHDIDFSILTEKESDIRASKIDAHLVAVENPDYNAKGDMNVDDDGLVSLEGDTLRYTYACAMIVSPRIFKGIAVEPAKLFPWLWQQRLTASIHQGFWGNIGDEAQYLQLIESAHRPDL